MTIHVHEHFTIHDLANLPDDGKRREIIDGDLIVSKQPHDTHQYVCANIIGILYVWNKQAKLGRIFDAPGVIFTDEDAVAPDVVWISTARRQAVERDGKLHGAPELAVEVMSPGPTNEKRDRETKRKLYSAWGVSEYWVMSWERREVEIYRRNAEIFGLALVATLRSEDMLQSPILPGFTCPVSDFFADLD